jgi:hypothetical protein
LITALEDAKDEDDDEEDDDDGPGKYEKIETAPDAVPAAIKELVRSKLTQLTAAYIRISTSTQS